MDADNRDRTTFADALAAFAELVDEAERPRPPRGRRPLPPEQRTDPFSLRLTADQRDAVFEAAARAGLTPAAWARQAHLEVARALADGERDAA